MKRVSGSKKPVVAVVGVGLMGGSLGQALVQSGRWKVLGVGRDLWRLRGPLAQGCAQEVTTDLSRIGEASVVVVCVPVSQVVPLVAKVLRPHFSPNTLVMDVGSVKGPIVKALASLNSFSRGPVFVGCHPLCGSEKTGAKNARADLYRGATCVITPTPRMPPGALRRARQFWRELGAKPILLDPQTHDRWLALVSHLPHLLAFSLVETVRRGGRTPQWIQKLIAGSFRDATRVAAADPEQWESIFQLNRRPLQQAAGQFQQAFSRLLAHPSARHLRPLQAWKQTLSPESQR